MGLNRKFKKRWKEHENDFEFGVAVWHSGVTVRMTEHLERIQKICINIILCDTGVKVNYLEACTLLNLEPLFYRVKFIQIPA